MALGFLSCFLLGFLSCFLLGLLAGLAFGFLLTSGLFLTSALGFRLALLLGLLTCRFTLSLLLRPLLFGSFRFSRATLCFSTCLLRRFRLGLPFCFFLSLPFRFLLRCTLSLFLSLAFSLLLGLPLGVTLGLFLGLTFRRTGTCLRSLLRLISPCFGADQRCLHDSVIGRLRLAGRPLDHAQDEQPQVQCHGQHCRQAVADASGALAGRSPLWFRHELS